MQTLLPPAQPKRTVNEMLETVIEKRNENSEQKQPQTASKQHKYSYLEKIYDSSAALKYAKTKRPQL